MGCGKHRELPTQGHDGDQFVFANFSPSGLMSEPRYYLGTLVSFPVLNLDALDANAPTWRCKDVGSTWPGAQIGADRDHSDVRVPPCGVETSHSIFTRRFSGAFETRGF